MSCSVHHSRLLDGAAMAIFVMMLAAGGLCMFGDMWEMTQAKELDVLRLGWFMRKLFPFKRSFDFNLTHILLFAICILLLSLRPEPVVMAVQDDSSPEDTKAGGGSSHDSSARDRRKKKEIRQTNED